MLVPVGLIAVVLLADSLSPAEVHLRPLLVAAPALTAAFAGPGPTALMGGLAVAADLGVAAGQGVLDTGNFAAQISALTVVSGLVFLFTVVRERNERRLSRSRSVAAVAQKVLLRPLPVRSGDLEFASLYVAAEEEAEMGGDLFGAARTAVSTRLIVGDVRGKGLPAYSHAALILGAFRAAAHRQATLPRLARHLDGAVRWDTSQWDTAPARPAVTATSGTTPADADVGELFATVALFDIPDGRRELSAISCGHPPALLLRDGRAHSLAPGRCALPIGLGTFDGPQDYDVGTFPFLPGDLLLLYTDGVIEARNAAGDFYPLSERAGAWSGSSPRYVLRRLREDLLAHTGGRLTDDAAVVAVRRLPQSEASDR
ncbi:PP2C family protein-serine/threonine phosphatase [Streptomyces noursei]|uniref:PP2C family protein-serine/threonine phosphatase n=1 Tax=Streptomyces noursei TaxID=1971 RepID=UPI003324E9AB